MKKGTNKINMTAFENAIPRGSKNAVTISELARGFGVDDRTIYKAVERLRKNGVFVCAVQSEGLGCFFPVWPEDAEHVRHFITTHKGMGLNHFGLASLGTEWFQKQGQQRLAV